MEMREAALGAILRETRNTVVRADEGAEQGVICNQHIEGVDSPRAVVVSFEESVENWLSATQHSALDSVAFVSVGEPVRSTAATTPTEAIGPAGTHDGVRIDGVGDPADLTALGLSIQSHLKTFHESGSGEVVVCFDSLSALVEAVSLRQAFRFLHLLTTLTRACDATAHYHYDDRLPTQDLETLRPLFDAELVPQHSRDLGMWTLESTSGPSATE